jgi:hypothetical protein
MNRTGTRPVLLSVPESYSVPSNDRIRPIKNRTQVTRNPSNQIPIKCVIRRLKSVIRARRRVMLSCAAFFYLSLACWRSKLDHVVTMVFFIGPCALVLPPHYFIQFSTYCSYLLDIHLHIKARLVVDTH